MISDNVLSLINFAFCNPLHFITINIYISIFMLSETKNENTGKTRKYIPDIMTYIQKQRVVLDMRVDWEGGSGNEVS